MTVLITGGTGRTGSKLARLLQSSGHSVLIASRAGAAPEPFSAVKFDWLDQNTFENPFKADSKIDRVLLVAPSVYNALEVMKPFIDLAMSKGAKRFVFISGTTGEKGSPPFGTIYEYIDSIGADYTILRATWFMENFSTFFYHSIREKNEFVSATGDGFSAFVATDDIAKAAYDAIIAEKSPNTDYFVVGPKLYTYDDAAAILSDVLGRKIIHRRISSDEAKAMYTSLGMPANFAAFLTSLEVGTAQGVEEDAFKSKKAIIGKKDLRDYFEVNKQAWIV